MKNKKSLLDKYDTVEQVSAADWAGVTKRAIKEDKDPKMAKAAIKAHFTMRLKTSSITVLREDGGYLGGGVNADPYYHIIKARNDKDLRAKVETLYDEIADVIDKDSKAYKKVIKAQDKKINSLIDEMEKIDIDGTSLQIISDPDFVTIR